MLFKYTFEERGIVKIRRSSAEVEALRFESEAMLGALQLFTGIN